jgi:isoleucyl-tRNA synthetase
LSPALSFTAHEAWLLHRGESAETIFAQTAADIPLSADAELLRQKWARIREARAVAMKAIEKAREAGEVGSSLQASLTLEASGETAQALASLGEDLRFVMITSEVHLREAAAGETEAQATPLGLPKCGRCWHLRADVGQDPAHPDLCGRCISNLSEPGERRHAA